MLHFFSACSKQLINKILLPFTSDLWCLIDLRGTIWMIDHCFFDFEQSHIHRSLCWHIPIRSFSLDQITIVSHPLKQLVLTSLHAILSKNLCKLSDQNLTYRFLLQHLQTLLLASYADYLQAVLYFYSQALQLSC